MSPSVIASHKMRSSEVKIRAAHERLRAKIDAVSEELDEVTSPHGVPTTDLGDEDSMVIAVDKVISSARRS